MSYITFSDSDEEEVVPLSVRLGSNQPKPHISQPEVIDINSSSPVPLGSPVDTISIPSSPLPIPSKSQASDLIERKNTSIDSPVPRASKQKKFNTPVASGSSKNPVAKKIQKKAVEPKSGDVVVDQPKPCKPTQTSTTSSQAIGKRPAPKISCRDCEARIDHSLLETHFSDEELRKAFAECEVVFKYDTKSLKPKTVTWIREIKVPIDVDDECSARERTALKEEDHVMVLLDAKDFAQMVHVYKLTSSLEEDTEVLSLDSSISSVEELDCADNESPVKHSSSPSFLTYCKRMCMTYPGKDVTILLVGLMPYFSLLKCKSNKKYRDMINGKDPSKKRRKSSMKHPLITKEDVTEVLVNLDLNQEEISSSGKKVRVIFADKSEDVVTRIASYTKSIAEAPHKIVKNESKSMAWFADNDKSISVDVKTVEDVPRVWQKQLEQFPKVSFPVADAISRLYPTPLNLLNEYHNIGDKNEMEALLEDISVGANGNRRVGPEISRKICAFMTAANGELFLGKS